jgi:hypothetical protein
MPSGGPWPVQRMVKNALMRTALVFQFVDMSGKIVVR